MARHAGHLSPRKDTEKNAHSLDSGSRERMDKQQPVGHVSRSRSVREKPSSVGLSGLQEQQPCPPLKQRTDATSKPTLDYNCETLISWIESLQQSYSDAMQQHGAEPLVKAGDSERGEASLLKTMESCNSSSQQQNIIDNLDNKMPVSVSVESSGVSQFKQRAKSEPARGRQVSRRKHDASCPDQGKRFRDKNSRAASEHRRCEPSTLDTSASAESQPLPSTVGITFPQHLEEFHTIEKNYLMHNAKCRDSHKRKSKSKKAKSKSIQPPQPIIEEQARIRDVDSKNRNNKEVQQPCESHSFLQKRKTGFRFGNVRKRSSKPRVLPTIREDPQDRPPREDPLDRPPREDKTAINQQWGDEASVPKKKSKKTEEPTELSARTACRECPEPEAINSMDVSPPASDAPTCGSETKPRRRKSSNLCPKKKQLSGSRKELTSGGNFFKSFADVSMSSALSMSRDGISASSMSASCK